ncbi:hypothetical protein ABIB28_003151 [Sphingomonas sp. UYEF23]
MMIAALSLGSCGSTRSGGALRLRHVVVVATAAGERTFDTVLRLDGYQHWNQAFGGPGWGAITCRLTGDALRTTVGDRDFLFLLSKPGETTPASTQIDLIKTHFGLPNWTADAGWVGQWKDLAASRRGVDLRGAELPAIAVMPHNGWVNDARIISLEEAERLGLRVIRYRLEITGESAGSSSRLSVRYRGATNRTMTDVGREMLTVTNGES